MPAKGQCRPAQERFWEKVDANGDCWEWTASRNNAGYGNFHPVDGTCVLAHRYAWESLIGPIPQGLVLDHRCRNTGCVNPDHLEPVTQSQNLLRGNHVSKRRGSASHCQRGHALTGDNLGIQGPGWRYCKTCKEAGRQRRIAERAA